MGIKIALEWACLRVNKKNHHGVITEMVLHLSIVLLTSTKSSRFFPHRENRMLILIQTNNNLSNAQKDITQLNGHKVSYYGVFDKTLEELYNLSKTNTVCYIGFIDWRQSEITISNGTIIWFACNWVVFAISGSGLYVLDGSTFKWSKV